MADQRMVLVPLEGGPWGGERRRFPDPPPATVLVKAGGEYRLLNDLGWRYRWHKDRLDDDGPREARA